MDEIAIEKLYWSLPDDFRRQYSLFDVLLAIALYEYAVSILKKHLLSN